MTAPSLDTTEAEIVLALRDVLAKEASLDHGLDASASSAGYDRSLLRQLADLGFFGVSTSPDLGGLGLAARVRGELCVEAGRVLLGGPWLEHLLAVTLLGSGAPNLLEGLVAGSTVVSLPLDAGTWRQPPVGRIEGGRVRFERGGCQLGFASSVDGWLVPVRDAVTGMPALVLLDADAARCTARRRWSELARSDDVDLAAAEGVVVGELADRAADAHLRETARLLACVAVGSTEALLAATTDFLKVRHQFGRPLGTFQALQHAMADVFIDLEHTRSLVRATTDEAAHDDDVLVSMAKVASDRLAVAAAETALQAHGGLGFTWELPVHHYLKEALRRRTLPEPTVAYRQALGDAVGDLGDLVNPVQAALS